MIFFKKADLNHDGMINKEELQLICQQTGIDFDIQELLDTIDLNKD